MLGGAGECCEIDDNNDEVVAGYMATDKSKTNAIIYWNHAISIPISIPSPSLSSLGSLLIAFRGINLFDIADYTMLSQAQQEDLNRSPGMGLSAGIAASSGMGMVHRGFQRSAMKVWQTQVLILTISIPIPIPIPIPTPNYLQVRAAVKAAAKEGLDIYICGHSIGGALALVTAGLISRDESILQCVKSVATFASPR